MTEISGYLTMLALAWLMSSCASPGAPTALAGKSAVGSPEAKAHGASPAFHVVAEGAGYAGDGVSLEPCPIGGRMFICRTSLEFRDGQFFDTGMRVPEGTAGSLPDDLWTIFRDMHGGRLMHFSPSNQQWLPTGFELRRLDEDMDLRTVTLRAWSAGTVLIVDEGPEGRIDVAVWANGRVQPAPSLLLKDGSRALDEVHGVEALRTGELLMVGPRGEERLVHAASWASRSERAVVELLGDGHCDVRGLVASSVRDVMIVGRHKKLGACVLRFDGERWSLLDLPSGHDGALSYARGPGLVEWILLQRPSSGSAAGEVGLWSRRPGSGWTRVVFPDPTPVARGFQVQQRFARIWVQDDGQVWLHLNYQQCGRRVLSLLTEQAPARGVCWIWGVHEECFAPERYPPDKWDWAADTCGP